MAFDRFDMLIRGGRVLDGTGNPYVKLDIGLSAGRIALLARDIDPERADQLLDVHGLAVCPGFIDTHTHDDLYVLVRPTADAKVLQGVTSVVTGNCGNSMTPKHRYRRGAFGRGGPEEIMEKVKGMSTFGEYLAAVEAARPGINVVPLVGHGSVRLFVIGSERRPPSTEELGRMKESVAAAMEEGAFGLSTGLIYPPGNYAETAEIVALAEVAARFHGVYTSHIRSEGQALLQALGEAIHIGEAAGLPVLISHHKAAGRPNWGKSKASLRLMEEARARGVEVSCDQYPYAAGSTFLGAALHPRHHAEGPKALSSKLRDPGYRQALIEELEAEETEGWENLLRNAGFENIVICQTEKHSEYLGRNLAELARAEGKSNYEFLFDLLAEETINVNVILFMMADEDIERIMAHPLTMIGTDGTPAFGLSRVHPRMSGTFPRVLGCYAREKGLLRLEEAVRKMTSLPAQTFNLKHKGLIREGYDADLVVFDPETIIDRATYAEPDLGPEGIAYVLVNGQIAADHGRITGATSGRVLRREA